MLTSLPVPKLEKLVATGLGGLENMPEISLRRRRSSAALDTQRSSTGAGGRYCVIENEALSLSDQGSVDASIIGRDVNR